MNTSDSKRPVRGLSACGLATLLLGTSLAVAKGYDIAIETVDMKAEPVEQALPAFPESDEVKKRQEGWVEVNFVVTPDGEAVDPIVTRSVGGKAFEQSALEAIKAWRFVPADGESGSNTVQIRFEDSKSSGKASRKFTQYYRMVLTDLASEKVLKARINLDRARRVNGWNLYEATILDILEAKVAEAEGDSAAQLAALRRALHLGNEAALTVKTRREILRGMVEVETATQQYASARESLAQLQAIKGSAGTLAELEDELLVLEQAATKGDIVVDAKIDCDCERSRWTHRPLHRSFAISEIDGNLERVEARCETRRFSTEVASDETIDIPEDWGNCEIFVFGDDGASFRFVEFGDGVAQVSSVP